jgi:hypothetical protein
MVTGTMCIDSKTMSTLQTVAPTPALVALSMPWFRR